MSPLRWAETDLGRRAHTAEVVGAMVSMATLFQEKNNSLLFMFGPSLCCRGPAHSSLALTCLASESSQPQSHL